MKKKNIILYSILLICLLISSINVFGESNNEMLILNVELLLNDYTREIYPIYRSPFLDEETQIKETLKFLYQRNDVKEILKIDNLSIEESQYQDFISKLDASIKNINTNINEKYKKTNDLPMLQKDDNNKTIDNSIKNTTVDVKIDGVIVTKDIKGYIENGRSIVPFRVIGEGLGVNIGYLFKNDLQVVWGVKYDVKVDMKIGDFRAYKNGKLLYMDSYPVVKNGVTYVPIRYFAELFDCEIEWDQQENMVNILTKKGVRNNEK